MAESRAEVERVFKVWEEQTKRLCEAVQRQGETREQKQRKAREMRGREEREMREWEERDARERENRAEAELALVQESPLWQCEHCSVMFPCCGVFCHRCHNGSGVCDTNDKKANQAMQVKCTKCGHKEEVRQ